MRTDRQSSQQGFVGRLRAKMEVEVSAPHRAASQGGETAHSRQRAPWENSARGSAADDAVGEARDKSKGKGLVTAVRLVQQTFGKIQRNAEKCGRNFVIISWSATFCAAFCAAQRPTERMWPLPQWMCAGLLRFSGVGLYVPPQRLGGDAQQLHIQRSASSSAYKWSNAEFYAKAVSRDHRCQPVFAAITVHISNFVAKKRTLARECVEQICGSTIAEAADATGGYFHHAAQRRGGRPSVIEATFS